MVEHFGGREGKIGDLPYFEFFRLASLCLNDFSCNRSEAVLFEMFKGLLNNDLFKVSFRNPLNVSKHFRHFVSEIFLARFGPPRCPSKNYAGNFLN